MTNRNPAEDPLPPGTVLGDYTIVRRLGAGGVSMVYEATHNRLRKRVALKALRREMAMQPDVLARFVQEGEAASRLRHPHVVDISDVGVVRQIPYLVMEYLEGEDMSATLARQAPLAITDIASLMLPVCSAVLAAHEDGIVHRDLKPANIFLARNRLGIIVSKLLDFGISKVSDSMANVHATHTTMMLGTASYMSPEQAMGARFAVPASDQYAIGVMMYEAAVGRRPFQDFESRNGLYHLLQAVVRGNYPAPCAIRPDLSPSFAAVITRAMAHDPAARFESVRELGRALLAFVDDAVQGQWIPAFGTPLYPDDDATTRALAWAPSQATIAAPTPAPARAATPPNVPPAPARDRLLQHATLRPSLSFALAGIVLVFAGAFAGWRLSRTRDFGTNTATNQPRVIDSIRARASTESTALIPTTALVMPNIDVRGVSSALPRTQRVESTTDAARSASLAPRATHPAAARRVPSRSDASAAQHQETIVRPGESSARQPLTFVD